MVSYIEFLISHPSFQYNQIYKLSYVNNQNKHYVDNKIYTENLWQKQQKKLLFNIIIISNYS